MTKNISWRGKTFSFLLRYLYFPVFVVRMRRNTINHKGNILFAFPFSRPPEHLRNILFYIFHNNAFSSSLENHRKYSGFKIWEILSGWNKYKCKDECVRQIFLFWEMKVWKAWVSLSLLAAEYKKPEMKNKHLPGALNLSL